MDKLALFMNVNTKNPQMGYFLCPIHCLIYRPGMYKLQVRKKHLKNEQKLNFTFQNKPLLSNLQHQQSPKMVRNDIKNLQIRLVQFEDQTKA